VRKKDWCQGRVVRWKKWKAEDDWESNEKVGEKKKDEMSQLLMRPDALSSWSSWPYCVLARPNMWPATKLIHEVC
jgi:hypothetical protein